MKKNKHLRQEFFRTVEAGYPNDFILHLNEEELHALSNEIQAWIAAINVAQHNQANRPERSIEDDFPF